MTQKTKDERVLNELIRSAKHAEPGAPTSAQRDAQIFQAMLEGERRIQRDVSKTRLPSRPTWHYFFGAFALAAAALLAFKFAWPSLSHAEIVSLATGDRVTRTPNSDVVFARVTEESRIISVHAGEALFDVVPLLADASFVVETDELEVSVRGTIFTVSREDSTSLVHVFEGRVEVREGMALTMVEAGQRYASGHGLVAIDSPVALQREGEAARLARERRPHVAPAETAAEPATELAVTETVTEPVAATLPEPLTSPRQAGEARVDLQALVASRDFEGALAAAQNVLRVQPLDRGARLVEAQALQGLRRFDAAATAYDSLARTGPPTMRAEAAFRAATLRYRELHDARGSLASLDAVNLAASPYAERALGLRARAQDAAGDADGARQTAARYLALFPEGGMQQAMQALLR